MTSINFVDNLSPNLIQNKQQIKPNIYSLFYCMIHDDGCLYTGNIDYLPDEASMCRTTKCCSTDWYNMGIISYDGKSVTVLRDVQTCYSRYGGGFEFYMYANSIIDEKFNNQELNEDEPLYKWFIEYNKLNGITNPL